MDKPDFDWGKEFDQFLLSLNKMDKAKLVTMIKKIEDVGLQTARRQQWVKKLETNLYEIRTRTNETFLRGIYFQIKENRYYITHGFKKKTNQIPKKEIIKAKQIRNNTEGDK